MRVAVILLLASTLAGCARVSSRALTEADTGARVEVSVGDVIEVSLEESPSTGYRWETVVVPDMLELVGDTYVEPDTDLVGVAGARVLRFQAVGDHAGVLRLEYTRPFEELPVPERVVEYIVVVGDAPWPPAPGGSAPGTSTATVPEA